MAGGDLSASYLKESTGCQADSCESTVTVFSIDLVDSEAGDAGASARQTDAASSENATSAQGGASNATTSSREESRGNRTSLTAYAAGTSAAASPECGTRTGSTESATDDGVTRTRSGESNAWDGCRATVDADSVTLVDAAAGRSCGSTSGGGDSWNGARWVATSNTAEAHCEDGANVAVANGPHLAAAKREWGATSCAEAACTGSNGRDVGGSFTWFDLPIGPVNEDRRAPIPQLLP